MIITVLATGAFLLFVLAGVLVFSKRRQNLEDEYQRTIPNLARARERRRLWAATTAASSCRTRTMSHCSRAAGSSTPRTCG